MRFSENSLILIERQCNGSNRKKLYTLHKKAVKIHAELFKNLFILYNTIQMPNHKRKIDMFLLGTHNRVGYRSPIKVLVNDVLYLINQHYYKIIDRESINDYYIYGIVKKGVDRDDNFQYDYFGHMDILAGDTTFYLKNKKDNSESLHYQVSISYIETRPIIIYMNDGFKIKLDNNCIVFTMQNTYKYRNAECTIETKYIFSKKDKSDTYNALYVIYITINQNNINRGIYTEDDIQIYPQDKLVSVQFKRLYTDYNTNLSTISLKLPKHLYEELFAICNNAGEYTEQSISRIYCIVEKINKKINKKSQPIDVSGYGGNNDNDEPIYV